MQTRIGSIFLHLVLVYFANADSSGHFFFGESNLCTRIETFEKSYVVPKTVRVKEKYKTWCLSFPPRCTAERFKIVRTNETVKVNITRTVYDCCKGYDMEDNACVPACEFDCGHGECIEPDTCLCEGGWKGHTCTEECEPNSYGKGCIYNCTCLNGGTCNKIDGSCSCSEGFVGTYCETPCHHDTYGIDCKEKCKCENSGRCDSKDGSCDCEPGYFGEHCEHRCEPGYHGEDCKYDCVCIPENTHSCDHVDGKCVCSAGYTGQFCERECDNFTYGNDCKSKCDCINGEYCDPITGLCYCKPGWIGETCSEKCEFGKFGENCMYKCGKCPSANASCNHVTGSCDCPPGTFGTLCDSECLEGYWGINCSNQCECINHEFCNVTTGECSCPTGWMQPNCSETCHLGWYGNNCSSMCNCSNGNSCEPETGICFSPLPSQVEKIIRDATVLIPVLGSLACLCIILVLIALKYRKVFSMLRPFLRFCRRNTMESNSTETVIAEDIMKPTNFSNPLYGSADNVRINQCMSVEAIEQAFPCSSDTPWQSVNLHPENKCAQEVDQKFSETGNENATKGEDQPCFQCSVLRRSENVNDTCVNEEIKRNSKRSSDKNSASVDVSPVNIDDDFVPDILEDIAIPVDGTYDTLKFVCRKVIPEELGKTSTNA